MSKSDWWMNSTVELSTALATLSNNTTFFADNNGSNLIQKHPKARAEPWLMYVSYISVPLLLVVGLCGNTLTIMVTRSRHYRHSSHGVYLTAMAVSDIIFLLAFPFSKRFILALFGQDVRAISLIGCKAYFFFFRASRSISASLIILICVERFVAVWFPLKVKYLSTKRAAIMACSCVFAGISTFSAVWTLIANVKNNKCIAVDMTEETKLVAEVCSAIGMSLRTCIPTVTLLFLTPLTVFKVYQQQSMRKQISSKNKGSTDETYRVTLMLISVNMAFYILITPFCIAKHAFLFAGTDIVMAPLRWARNLHEVSQICEQTNCVINFILYVVLSSSFRRHFLAIFKRHHENEKPRMSVDTVSSRYNSISKL